MRPLTVFKKKFYCAFPKWLANFEKRTAQVYYVRTRVKTFLLQLLKMSMHIPLFRCAILLNSINWQVLYGFFSLRMEKSSLLIFVSNLVIEMKLLDGDVKGRLSFETLKIIQPVTDEIRVRNFVKRAFKLEFKKNYDKKVIGLLKRDLCCQTSSWLTFLT